MTSGEKNIRWWGSYRFEEGETACWQLGTLQLWVQRGKHEWRLAARQQPPGAEAVVDIRRRCGDGIPADAPVQIGYAFRDPGEEIVLEPRLPDRPLVWRPQQPLSMAPGEETTVYLRTPLWLGFRVGHRSEVLWEWPLRRLSDTWFGPSTRDGGYAYSADRGAVCSDAPEPDTRTATIPVVIRNAADTTLRLDRLNLPVTYLSLFAGERGVWTQRVVLERGDEEEEVALLSLSKGAPREAVGPERVAGPRFEADTRLVFQAFSRLFE